MSAPDGSGREVAYRLFAAEYDDVSLEYAESDEERAPNYVITPTGARVNRLFLTGTLTEVTSVNEEMVRARVVDPTGAFVIYAGQYEPDALAFLERADPPMFVAVTGKARTFQPDDSHQVYTSVRPESLATIDADTRDRWVVSTAEQTIDRIAAYASAAGLDASGDALTVALTDTGLEDGLATGIPRAQTHYGTTPAYLDQLRELAINAVRVVAGDQSEAGTLGLQPSASDDRGVTFGDLGEVFEGDAVTSTATANTETDQQTPPEEPMDSAQLLESAAAADTPVADSSETVESGADVATDFNVEDEGQDEAVDASAANEPELEDELTLETESESDAASELTDTAVPEPTDTTSAALEDVGSAVDDEMETEPESESQLEPETDTDELGDFESDGLEAGMYEMDDEEREELEAEFGADFTTGTEVEAPGESDIEPPESEPEVESEPEPEPELELEVESESAEPTPASEPEPTDEEQPDEDTEIDLEEAVITTMTALDDGDGADREALIDRVSTETGSSADEVEEAIQDALMGGKCYEPGDDVLKAI